MQGLTSLAPRQELLKGGGCAAVYAPCRAQVVRLHKASWGECNKFSMLARYE